MPERILGKMALAIPSGGEFKMRVLVVEDDKRLAEKYRQRS